MSYESHLWDRACIVAEELNDKEPTLGKTIGDKLLEIFTQLTQDIDQISCFIVCEQKPYSDSWQYPKTFWYKDNKMVDPAQLGFDNDKLPQALFSLLPNWPFGIIAQWSVELHKRNGSTKVTVTTQGWKTVAGAVWNDKENSWVPRVPRF